VIAFDQDNERIYSGAASDWGAAQDKKLIERGAAGASDLGQALAALQTSRVVIVTDGVMTAGGERAQLEAALKRFERADIVLAGGIRDEDLAAALARASKHAGTVVDLADGGEQIAAALAEPVLTD